MAYYVYVMERGFLDKSSTYSSDTEYAVQFSWEEAIDVCKKRRTHEKKPLAIPVSIEDMEIILDD